VEDNIFRNSECRSGAGRRARHRIPPFSAYAEHRAPGASEGLYSAHFLRAIQDSASAPDARAGSSPLPLRERIEGEGPFTARDFFRARFKIPPPP